MTPREPEGERELEERELEEREAFLWRRSVEISAFEALTEEEDARLWAEALRDAEILWPTRPSLSKNDSP